MANPATHATRGEEPSFTPEFLSVGELHLDGKNPRIQQVGEDLEQESILKILWDEYSVDEVALSIAENGFFPHEALFATEEDGRLVVVEGNRRLAAIRLLREPDLRERLGVASLPTISDEDVANLADVPVIRCKRDKIWQYIGFKHVNGPQAWASLAKAEYIAWVKNEVGTTLEKIALTIGDNHSTVARLYRAYMALQQAEAEGVYDRTWRTRKHFSFSHLYTGLDYQGIREFTRIANLDPPKAKPIPNNRLKQFGELCVWLWGDEREGKVPLIKSQNPDLRLLDRALQSKDGLSALRASYGISVAVDIARGDTALFREALLKSKQSLQNARAKVATGFEGEKDLSREMEEILVIADALDDDMRTIATDPLGRQRDRRRRRRAQRA